jgi:hypothetical protein
MSEKNPAMCIWLGKQYLDQREPQALEKNSTPVNDLTITQLIDALHAHKVKKDAKDEAKADAHQQ